MIHPSTRVRVLGAVVLAASLVATAFAAAPDRDQPGHVEVPVTIRAGGHDLSGTLHLPDRIVPHPAIVLVSGSGAQDRDGVHPAMPGYAPLGWLADHLVRHGIAALVYDERGVGQSGGDHASATTYDLAEDAEAALRFLHERFDIDPERIGILGHSEGGVIAAIVASRPPGVAFVISLAGSAVPYAELTVSQVQRIAAAQGADPEQVAEAAQQQRAAIDLALSHEWEELEAYLAEVLLEQVEAAPAEARAGIADPEAFARLQAAAQVAALRAPWIHTFMRLDPADHWRSVDVPVLAVFGDLDVQVDVDVNRPPLEAALAEAGAEDVTIVVLEGANHLFQRARHGGPDEYPTLEMAFHPELLDLLTGWLEQRFVDGD